MPEKVVETIPEAIAAMHELCAVLPEGDGVACFNSMYLRVTEAVGAQLDEGVFVDPQFMDRLDVNFANLYLGAYAQSTQGRRPTCARRGAPCSTAGPTGGSCRCSSRWRG